MDITLFIEPDALMQIMDKGGSISISESRSGKLEVVQNPDDDIKKKAEKIEQDGVQVFLQPGVNIPDGKQISIRLERGIFRKRLSAAFSQKQSVPGFMGVRSCGR